MKNLLYLLFTAAIVLFGCKSDDDEVSSSQTERLNEVIGPVLPGEMVLVNGSFVSGSIYQDTLSGQEVRFFAINDSTLAFYVPDLPEGSFNLEFELGKIQLNVSALQNFDIENEINSATVALNELEVEYQNSDYITNAGLQKFLADKQSLISTISNYSESEKRNFALIYHANKYIINDLIQLEEQILTAPIELKTNDLSTCSTNVNKDYCTCVSDELYPWGKKIVGYTLLSIATGVLGGPIGVFGAATILAYEVGPRIEVFWNSIDDLYALPCVADDDLSFGKTLLATTFASGQSKSIGLTPTWRTLNATDGAIHPSFGLIISIINQLNEAASQLEYFLDVAPPTFNINTTDGTLTDLQIAISSSNPSVTVQNVQLPDLVTFSTQEETPQNFSYTVTIQLGGYVLQKTANAILEPTNNISSLAQGHWNIHYVPTGCPGTVDHFTFFGLGNNQIAKRDSTIDLDSVCVKTKYIESLPNELSYINIGGQYTLRLDFSGGYFSFPLPTFTNNNYPGTLFYDGGGSEPVILYQN